MAAVIGDFVPDLSRFHTMIASSSSLQQHHQTSSSSSPSNYRSSSTPRSASAAPRSQSQSRIHSHSHSQNHSQRPDSDAEHVSTTTCSAGLPDKTHAHACDANTTTNASSTGGASRFPSPPPSSSPAAVAVPASADDGKPASMAPQTRDHHVSPDAAQPPSSNADAARAAPPRHQQQPSPASDDFRISRTGSYLVSASAVQPIAEENIIHIRDLAHIESLAQADQLGGDGSGSGILQDPPLHQMKYEISGMPIGDVIEMVAALLTKITTTNDLQHDAMQRNATHQQQASQSSDSNGGSQMSPLSHSVLAFHGKNVPAITILSYLSRIHKYCPTTYEVFLSLLVYFDRMTERVNDMIVRSEEMGTQQAASRSKSSRAPSIQQDSQMREGGDAEQGSEESDSDLADDDDDDDDVDNDDDMGDAPAGTTEQHEHATTPATSATYFVVDSFNIHRLVISGVTCASKFFSDVFYTNSRYAKVCKPNDALLRNIFGNKRGKSRCWSDFHHNC